MAISSVGSSATQGSTLPVAASYPPSQSQNGAGNVAQPQAVPSPSSAQVKQAVQQVNNSFNQNSQNVFATFTKDPTTGIEVIKFLDQETKQTISQVPSKAILAIAESLQTSSNSGQLVNTTA